jgi:hypothetical protein
VALTTIRSNSRLSEVTRGQVSLFPTLQEALKAVEELLPLANSAEERAKAKDMEELLWLMLRQEADEGTL